MSKRKEKCAETFVRQEKKNIYYFKPHVTIRLKDMKKYNFGRLCNSESSDIWRTYELEPNWYDQLILTETHQYQHMCLPIFADTKTFPLEIITQKKRLGMI